LPDGPCWIGTSVLPHVAKRVERGRVSRRDLGILRCWAGCLDVVDGQVGAVSHDDISTCRDDHRVRTVGTDADVAVVSGPRDCHRSGPRLRRARCWSAHSVEMTLERPGRCLRVVGELGRRDRARPGAARQSRRHQAQYDQMVAHAHTALTHPEVAEFRPFVLPHQQLITPVEQQLRPGSAASTGARTARRCGAVATDSDIISGA